MTMIFEVELDPEIEVSRQEWAAEQKEKVESDRARQATRKSALAKLTKLGMTDDEIEVILGAG